MAKAKRKNGNEGANTQAEAVESQEPTTAIGPDEAIQIAFTDAATEGKDEDSIKMAMIQAGCAFKKVAKMYNEFMIGAGFISSKEERVDVLDDVLFGKTLIEEDVFISCIAEVVLGLKGTNEKSASSMIRAWAKKAEIDCYKKPKGEGSGRSGFNARFYDWLYANPQATSEQAKAYIMGTDGNDETTQNIRNHSSKHLGVYKLFVGAYQKGFDAATA